MQKIENGQDLADLSALLRQFMDAHPDLDRDAALVALREELLVPRAAPANPADEFEKLRKQKAELISRTAAEVVQDWKPTPHRHVELYLGFPINEPVRQMFEDWLGDHPEISEEDAAAHLLTLGLVNFRQNEAELELRRRTDLTDSSRATSRSHRRIAKLRAITGGQS